MWSRPALRLRANPLQSPHPQSIQHPRRPLNKPFRLHHSSPSNHFLRRTSSHRGSCTHAYILLEARLRRVAGCRCRTRCTMQPTGQPSSPSTIACRLSARGSELRCRSNATSFYVAVCIPRYLAQMLVECGQGLWALRGFLPSIVGGTEVALKMGWPRTPDTW